MTLAIGPLVMVLSAGIPAGTPRPVAEVYVPQPAEQVWPVCPWLGFSPDGRILAALVYHPNGPTRLVAWDTARWTIRQDRMAEPPSLLPPTVRACVFDPKTNWVGLPGQDGLRFLNPTGPGEQVMGRPGEPGATDWIAVHVVGGGYVVITAPAIEERLELIAWRPDRRQLFRSQSLGFIRAADVCAGLTHAAAGYEWPTKDGRKAVAELIDLKTGGRTPLPGHDGGCVKAVLFRPDGRRLATTDGASVIRLWDVPTGRLIRTVRGGAVFSELSLAYSPDGRHLACGSYDDGGVPNLWLLDATDGGIRASIPASRRSLLRIAYHPDGRLATIDNDLRIRVWQPADLIR